jgi:hypothetical protein
MSAQEFIRSKKQYLKKGKRKVSDKSLVCEEVKDHDDFKYVDNRFG